MLASVQFLVVIVPFHMDVFMFMHLFSHVFLVLADSIWGWGKYPEDILGKESRNLLRTAVDQGLVHMPSTDRYPSPHFIFNVSPTFIPGTDIIFFIFLAGLHVPQC